MKLKRLAALVLAVMMTLTAASVTGLSKLAAEGTQKPEKSVVDAAGNMVPRRCRRGTAF